MCQVCTVSEHSISLCRERWSNIFPCYGWHREPVNKNNLDISNVSIQITRSMLYEIIPSSHLLDQRPSTGLYPSEAGHMLLNERHLRLPVTQSD